MLRHCKMRLTRNDFARNRWVVWASEASDKRQVLNNCCICISDASDASDVKKWSVNKMANGGHTPRSGRKNAGDRVRPSKASERQKCLPINELSSDACLTLLTPASGGDMRFGNYENWSFPLMAKRCEKFVAPSAGPPECPQQAVVAGSGRQHRRAQASGSASAATSCRCASCNRRVAAIRASADEVRPARVTK